MELDDLRKDFHPEPPEQVKTPDLTALREVCQVYMDEVSKGGYVDEDLQHYIYEAALTAIFGEGVFSYVNKARDP